MLVSKKQYEYLFQTECLIKFNQFSRRSAFKVTKISMELTNIFLANTQQRALNGWQAIWRNTGSSTGEILEDEMYRPPPTVSEAAGVLYRMLYT